MRYWPGTNIVKSTNNAFDWRKERDSIANSKEFKQSYHSTMVNSGNGAHKNKTFTIYSRAKASK